MVEATWRLLSIGTQYIYSGDSRKDPRFEATVEIIKQMESHLEKKYGVPVKKYLKAVGQTGLEARVIDILQNQSMNTMPERANRRRMSDSTLDILSKMEVKYMTMLLGAQKIIAELERKNEALKHKLAQMDKLQDQ